MPGKGEERKIQCWKNTTMILYYQLCIVPPHPTPPGKSKPYIERRPRISRPFKLGVSCLLFSRLEMPLEGRKVKRQKILCLPPEHLVDKT
jgi:hypothetical protein